MRIKYCLLILVSILFAACGGGGGGGGGGASNPPTTDQDGVEAQVFYGAVSSLPTCASVNSGKLYYTVADSKFRVCEHGEWQVIDLKGPTGLTGPQGPQGLQGEAGESATMEDGTAIGQILRWNGTEWVAVSVPNAVINLSYSGAVNIWKYDIDYADSSTGSLVAEGDLTWSVNYSTPFANVKSLIGMNSGSSVELISDLYLKTITYDAIESYLPLYDGFKILMHDYLGQEIESNTVSFVTKSTVTQISNTSGDQTVTDSPYQLTSCGNYIFYTSMGELYSYDETTTRQLNTNLSGMDNPANLTCLNGQLHYQAVNSSGYNKYFISDGMTSTQFVNIKGNTTNDTGSDKYLFCNSKVYFSSQNTSNQYKLFVYDPSVTPDVTGTPGAGVAQVSNTRNGNTDSIGFMNCYDNKVYFSASNSSGYNKMFVYDTSVTPNSSSGIGAGVAQVSNTRGATGSDSIYNISSCNSKLFFRGSNSSGYNKLFVYDPSVTPDVTGTPGAGVVQVSNSRNGSSEDPFLWTCIDNKLYYSAYDSSGYNKVFVYDTTVAPNSSSGIGAGVAQVSNTLNGSYDNCYYASAHNNLLFFKSRNSDNNYKLFVYDTSVTPNYSVGVGAGVSQVTNIADSGQDDISVPNDNYYPQIIDNKLYFISHTNDFTDSYIYSYDTTVAPDSTSGYGQGVSISHLFNADFSRSLRQLNNKLYFVSNHNGEGVNKVFRLE